MKSKCKGRKRQNIDFWKKCGKSWVFLAKLWLNLVGITLVDDKKFAFFFLKSQGCFKYIISDLETQRKYV